MCTVGTHASINVSALSALKFVVPLVPSLGLGSAEAQALALANIKTDDKEIQSTVSGLDPSKQVILTTIWIR